MPFQDIDDAAETPLPQPPTQFELWLRKIFLEDWGLKLLALGIAVVLWLSVTGQNKPVTQRLSGVQLNFLKHPGLEISNDPISSVEVTVNGSPGLLDQLKLRDLVVTVDISSQKAGERVVRLSPESAQMDLPPGVKILYFRPATIPIRLEPTVELALPVEVKLEGDVVEGYEVTGTSVNPGRIRVRGPADRVNILQKATTETVRVDGRKEGFSLARVAINISDPKIEILDPNVEVRVEIAARKSDDSKVGSQRAGAPYIIATAVPHHRH
ncbi:MAG TPA: CdaR family protein [Pyrinomonadaceae bacterium]|nr:CdaR family protein [Pyrinomonadaceae bacterium]